MRPDGVAEIRLPTFMPWDKAFPTTATEIDAFRAAFQAEIVKVFDTVKTAPAILSVLFTGGRNWVAKVPR